MLWNVIEAFVKDLKIKLSKYFFILKFIMYELGVSE